MMNSVVEMKFDVTKVYQDSIEEHRKDFIERSLACNSVLLKAIVKAERSETPRPQLYCQSRELLIFTSV